MTLRKGKEKTQQTYPKFLENPSYNLYLNPTLQELPKQESMHDFRSLSKGKHKMKLHMFQFKYTRQGQQHSPVHKDLLKSYSSFGTLPNEATKAKVTVRQYLAEKNALLEPTKPNKAKQKPQEQKRTKREFRLIHQIKNNKAQEKHKKQTEDLQRNSNPIQAGTHQKMDAFAQEMVDLISNSSKALEEAKAVPSNWISLKEPSLKESLRQPTKLEKTKLQMPQQSFVQMNLPSKLFQSQQRPQITQKLLIEEEYKLPDLSRSFSKAEKLLKRRKDSSSSIDISFRQSKVRAEISLSLALQSIQGSRIDLSAFYKDIQGNYKSKQKLTCRDKVNAHLQILHSMSQFVYESIKFDEIGQEWEQLNFLIYKKYYIQCRKVLNFIQKYPMRNPFCIYNAEISSKEIIQFIKTQEGSTMLSDLKKETTTIKQKLASIYSKFDKAKVGQKINLYEYDNFSHWIIEELWTELILTEHNTSHSKQEISVRLCRILQLIFLISELNGKYECSFQEAQSAIADSEYSQYIKEGKTIFERYILYKQVADESEQY